MTNSNQTSWVSAVVPVIAGLVGIGILFAGGIAAGVALWASIEIPRSQAAAPSPPLVYASLPVAGEASPYSAPENTEDPTGSDAGPPAPAPEPAPVADPAALAAEDSELREKLLAVGQQTYQLCLACHGPEGNPLVPNMAPTLVGSSLALSDKDTLVKLLLKGIQPGGGQYVGVMVGWAPQLSDEQIAGVATYIRKNFGNNATLVEPELVAELRTETDGRAAPYSRAELEAGL